MAPRIPPVGTQFLEIEQDRDGQIVDISMSREWQHYFGQVAQFQEAVGVALKLSDIQSALDATQTSLENTLTTDVQAIIDAGASSLFGSNYKGLWAAGSHAVGNVVYHSGFFYECDVARTSSDTDDPATDTTGWSLRSYTVMLTGDVTVDLSSVQTAIQNAIDAQGTASFGDSYQGAWAAGIFAVGNVSYSNGAFYTCTVARTAANTSNPGTDTSSWSIQVSESGGLDAAVQAAIDASATIQFGESYTGVWERGVHAVGDIVYFVGKFYECTIARTNSNSNNPVFNSTAWDVIQSRRQAEADSLGYANFGSDYKGAWEAGAFVVGNVAFYGGRYYECSVARAATDTDDPATDASSWDVVGSSVSIDLSSIEASLSDLETSVGSARTDISAAAQAQIDAIGANAYGDSYQGAWAAGAYAVGNVAYYDGMFYECTTTRTSSNTDNPATDTSSWDVADSSVTVDLGSIETSLSDLETELGSARTDISDAIQAQIDAIGANAYGDNYQGEWAPGTFAIGNVVYFDGKFYECDVPRNSSHTSDPTINTGAWTVVDSTVTVDFSSIESTLSDLETELDSTRTDIGSARQEQIDAAARIAYGEDYQGGVGSRESLPSGMWFSIPRISMSAISLEPQPTRRILP